MLYKMGDLLYSNLATLRVCSTCHHQLSLSHYFETFKVISVILRLRETLKILVC